MGVDGIPIDGSGGAESPETPLFPMNVGKSRQIIASTAHGVTFSVYESATGELVQHRLGGSLDSLEEVVVSSQWTQGLTHVVEVGVDEGRALLGYDRTSGWVEVVAGEIEDGDVVVGETSSGSPGWSELISFELDGASKLLCYGADSGQFRLGTFDSTDPDVAPPFLGQWPSGYSQLVVLASGNPGDPARVLAFLGATSEFELYQRQADDSFTLLGRGSLQQLGIASSYTLFTSFSKSGTAHLVLYAPTTGSVVSGVLDATFDGSLTFRLVDSSTWPGGLTELEPTSVEGVPVALIYNETTGSLDVFGLDPLEHTNPPVVR